jgi:protein transport protein SEC23
MDFNSIEQTEGIRFIWNNIPHSRLEASQNVIPISALYSPFSLRENPITRTDLRQLVCTGCSMVANRFCAADYQQMRWDCINCSHRNVVPNNYRDYIQQGNRVLEFMNENSALEFKVSQGMSVVWLLVVDTCVEEAELDIVKKGLIRQIEAVDSLHVGLISFGKHVHVHDLASDYLNEAIVNGDSNYSGDKVRALLGLKAFTQTTQNTNRFVMPIEKCKDKLIKVLRRLKHNQFERKSTERALRSTGCALNIGSVILESMGTVGRMTAVVGGACTHGQGKVISNQLTETFRDHTNLEDNSDKIEAFKNAQKAYDLILERAIKIGVSVDLFAFSLDQFGCAEMRNMVERSGGIVVNQEQFECDVFDKSLDKYVATLLGDSGVFGANMKVITCKDFFVSGALGSLRLTVKSPNIPSDADGLIGETGGNDFYLGGCSTNSTYLMFMGHRNSEVPSKTKTALFQFQTTYIDKKGCRVLRVATFQREVVNNLKLTLSGFDQEAAIACVSRISAFKSEKVEVVDLVYWLNSVLIKFSRRFTTFEKDKPETLRTPDEISLIPQFMFYFRKSYFVQKFATSVDESALYKMTLNRESLANMLVMIQPAVFQYDLNESEPVPVFCDFESLKPDVVLLVDTYFNLLIWRGVNVHAWFKDGMHLQPEYEHINCLFTQPMEDAKIILEDRLPVPKIIVCHQGSPDERILKSKMNPPSAQSNNELYRNDENYITDDVNLSVFTDYLSKLIVKKD